MKAILALECSATPSSLHLESEEGEALYTHQWEQTRNHDAELFPALQQALARLEEAEGELSFILVGAGPGSYGGVRVALAAAAGISIVKGVEVIAIDSWAQLSEQQTRGIISDAKRGGWTLRNPQGQIQVYQTEELKQFVTTQKLRVASVEPSEKLEALDIPIEQHSLYPEAKGLIATWKHLSTQEQDALRLIPPAPIYVRPPHITQAKRKPWECKG